jgi:hypothetical protein
MYKQIEDKDGLVLNTIWRVADNAFIPLDPANSDYQQFKKHLAEGRELQDADGIPLSTQAVAEFLEKLS